MAMPWRDPFRRPIRQPTRHSHGQHGEPSYSSSLARVAAELVRAVSAGLEAGAVLANKCRHRSQSWYIAVVHNEGGGVDK